MSSGSLSEVIASIANRFATTAKPADWLAEMLEVPIDGLGRA